MHEFIWFLEMGIPGRSNLFDGIMIPYPKAIHPTLFLHYSFPARHPELTARFRHSAEEFLSAHQQRADDHQSHCWFLWDLFQDRRAATWEGPAL